MARPHPRDFDVIFQEESSQVLSQVFGDDVAQAILGGLKTFSTNHQKSGDSIDTFSNALQQILGSGSRPIEYLILRHLFSRFELSFEQKSGHDFTDCVNKLRKIAGARANIRQAGEV